MERIRWSVSWTLRNFLGEESKTDGLRDKCREAYCVQRSIFSTNSIFKNIEINDINNPVNYNNKWCINLHYWKFSPTAFWTQPTSSPRSLPFRSILQFSSLLPLIFQPFWLTSHEALRFPLFQFLAFEANVGWILDKQDAWWTHSIFQTPVLPSQIVETPQSWRWKLDITVITTKIESY